MRNKTILLAEDSPAQRLLLEYAVKEVVGTRARLETVSGGEPVLNYLKGAGDFADRSRYPYPDLLVLDLDLPGMDGFEVLDWVRNRPLYADLPILVLSLMQEDKIVGRAYRFGADAYVKKPMNYEGLIAIVQCIERLLCDEEKSFDRLRTLPGYRERPAYRSAG